MPCPLGLCQLHLDPLSHQAWVIILILLKDVDPKFLSNVSHHISYIFLLAAVAERLVQRPTRK